MQQDLKVALIQTDLVWESPAQNRARFDVLIAKIPTDIDVIVLPEMFTSGFTMCPEDVAEPPNGPTTVWLQAHAKSKNSAICGSVAISENGKYYNRFLFVTPDGAVKYYNKRHTFNMVGEGLKYTKGSTPAVVKFRGCNIYLQVCYDLRFPVFSRNTMGYDVLIYVANWPKTRIAHWDALLKARAIENQCYTIGVNRVGVDGNALAYSGHSAVYNAMGDMLAFEQDNTKVILTTLSKSALDETRAALPFLRDQDQFNLEG